MAKHFHERRELTKRDLEEILNITHVFDKLRPDLNYTLRNIAARASKRKTAHEIELILGTLKTVNDKLNLLERVGSIASRDDPEEIGAYLYKKKLNSAAVIQVLVKYNNEHYKTPLAKYTKDMRSLEEFT